MDLPFSQWANWFFDIFLAGLLGYLIGLEREIIGKEAGSRTLALVSIGSCLFTLLSREAFLGLEFADPTRIASGIVIGLGFLGGGIIVFKKEKIEGLTTAAALWTVAGVGMAIGSHFYALSLIASFFIFLVLLAKIDIEGKYKTWKERKEANKKQNREKILTK